MSEVTMLDSGLGSFFKYRLLTETRTFEQVEQALEASGLKERHSVTLLGRPTPNTAFTRSMGYLTRVCASSIPFPNGSANASWLEGDKTVTGERNPNYSLKIESVKGMPENEIAYRINISDRRSKDQDMAHVLTATYRPGLPVEILPGDQAAWDKYGEDIRLIVLDAYTKFFSNYDDTDVRDVVVKELASLLAVNVLGKTTNFIAKDTEARPDTQARAKKLVEFVQACGHEGILLGLNSAPTTRDAIVSELRQSIMADLEDYEARLDDALNAKTNQRQRGEKQRERMKTTAEGNIDKIMALAEYHSTVLGVVAEGIREKAAQIKSKAMEFLTRDFGTGVPATKASSVIQSDLEKRIAELTAENARLKSFQGVGAAGVHAQLAPVVTASNDPFAAA